MEKCHTCGQKMRDARREYLNKHKLIMLKTAAGHVLAKRKNDFSLSELSGEVNHYTNWQKLRYHGLIHHVRENGVKQRGRWFITPRGWAFLKGDVELPNYVLVKNNMVSEHSVEMIHVEDVYQGSEAVYTTFEYIDQHGNIYNAPSAGKSREQGVLL